MLTKGEAKVWVPRTRNGVLIWPNSFSSVVNRKMAKLARAFATQGRGWGGTCKIIMHMWVRAHQPAKEGTGALDTKQKPRRETRQPSLVIQTGGEKRERTTKKERGSKPNKKKKRWDQKSEKDQTELGLV